MVPQSSFTAVQTAQLEKTRQFLLHVYSWMSFGLALTAVIALAVYQSESAIYWLAQHRGAFYGLLIVEFLLVIGFTAAMPRATYATVLTMFLAYAALNGVTFSFIFLVFTAESIASTFFITAGTFAGVSLYGMTTKRDLTGIGHFMGMALWGVILAIIVNMFLRSPAMSYGISMIAVIVFVGLTAYDTQKLRQMSIAGTFEDETPSDAELSPSRKKLALSGALTLYLDFVNLFVHLLNLVGRRR